MEHFIERIRNTFRRTTDRLAGQHVPVIRRAPVLENLEQRRLLTPPVDILENDTEVLIRADAPGAFPDNTWVYWDEHNGLSLHVQRAADATTGRVFGENLEGDWYRTFALPDHVEGSEARATVKAGVVSVHVPKRKAAAPTLIPVTAS